MCYLKYGWCNVHYQWYLFKPNPTFLTSHICVLLYVFLMPCICTNKDIINIVTTIGLQLSVLQRLSFILNTNVKMAALHSFIKFHLQYCKLVWTNQSKRGMSSLKKRQERGLRFVYNNYTTQYVDLLRKALCMATKCSYWSIQGIERSIIVHAMYVHTKQKQPQSTFW